MNDSPEKPSYRYRGARAMVILHELHMREFLDTWKAAKRSLVTLPETDDPNYRSLDALLRHVLHWAREYMVWICEMLELPNPDVPPTPGVDEVMEKCETHVEALLARWKLPLSDVPEVRFHRPEYLAPWKIRYCIDAMLEHAVMHPIRHRFQLMELMRDQHGTEQEHR